MQAEGSQAAIWIIAFYVVGGSIFGYLNPAVFIISFIAGYISGAMFLKDMRKKLPFYSTNEQQYKTMRKNYLYFKKEEIPVSKSERAEYKKYIDMMSLMNTSANTTGLLFFGIGSAFYALELLGRNGLHTLGIILLVGALFMLSMALYGWYAIKKISRIQRKLAAK